MVEQAQHSNEADCKSGCCPILELVHQVVRLSEGCSASQSARLEMGCHAEYRKVCVLSSFALVANLVQLKDLAPLGLERWILVSTDEDLKTLVTVGRS